MSVPYRYACMLPSQVNPQFHPSRSVTNTTIPLARCKLPLTGGSVIGFRMGHCEERTRHVTGRNATHTPHGTASSLDTRLDGDHDRVDKMVAGEFFRHKRRGSRRGHGFNHSW